MSRFEELDHRLGRHVEPHPNCPICDPSVAVNAPPPLDTGPKYWDFDSIPAFPNYGALWKHRDEIVTFVQANGNSGTPSGFWAPTSIVVEDPHRPVIDTLIDACIPRIMQKHVQMEMGSGQWAPRVQQLAIKQILPNETARHSPLGVDLGKWSQDKNHAELIVKMSISKLFPVSEITHVSAPDLARDTTTITSVVRVIEIPSIEHSDQMTIPLSPR
jgi:hypothetical protein